MATNRLDKPVILAHDHIYLTENMTIDHPDKPMILTHYLDGNSEIWIKFTYFIKSLNKYRSEGIVLEASPGSVRLKKFRKIQRFYSRLLLVDSSADRLDVQRSGGKKVIKVRDILFLDAQLYVKTNNIVLRMEDKNGFLALKIPESEYRSIIKQLIPISHG